MIKDGTSVKKVCKLFECINVKLSANIGHLADYFGGCLSGHNQPTDYSVGPLKRASMLSELIALRSVSTGSILRRLTYEV